MKRFLVPILAALALVVGGHDAQAQTFSSVQVANGQCNSPAYTFLNNSTTGFILVASGQIGVCVNGNLVATVTSTGVSSSGTLANGLVQTSQSQGRVSVAGVYTSSTASSQSLAGDLTLSGTGLGHTGGYIAGGMGNVLGDATITAAGNNAATTAGLVGKYTIADLPPVNPVYTPGYPRAGVVGEMAASGDAAIVAVVTEGDQARVAPRAYYSVDSQISTSGGSTVQYGLDLQGPGAHDVYAAVAFSKAEIRLVSGAWILSNANCAAVSSVGVFRGTLCLDSGNGKAFIWNGSAWAVVGSQS